MARRMKKKQVEQVVGAVRTAAIHTPRLKNVDKTPCPGADVLGAGYHHNQGAYWSVARLSWSLDPTIEVPVTLESLKVCGVYEGADKRSIGVRVCTRTQNKASPENPLLQYTQGVATRVVQLRRLADGSWKWVTPTEGEQVLGPHLETQSDIEARWRTILLRISGPPARK